MNRFDILITGYAVLLLLGGLIGYFVAGSTSSLLMSSIFSFLLIGSLFLSRPWPQFANKAISILLLILTLFFAYRWYNGKFMPSGLLAILTLCILSVSIYLRKTHESK